MLTYQNSDGVTCLTLGLDMTVYVRRSFYDCAEGVVSFYRRAMQEIGEDVKWYFTESMERPRKVSSKTFEMVPSWFAEGARRRKILQMTLCDGAKADEIVPRRFQMLSSDAAPGEDPGDAPELDTGVLRLVLPLDVLSNPDDVVSLFIALTDGIPFVSGHAGYGLVWDELAMDSDVKRRIFALSRRYPGLDVYGFLAVRQFIRSGIKCVNWLTLLGDGAVGRLKSDLINGLAVEGVDVRRLKGGILLRASKTPLLGDVNLGDHVAAYNRVGAALRSVRDVPDEDSIYPFVGDEEQTLEWLARYDREETNGGW